MNGYLDLGTLHTVTHTRYHLYYSCFCRLVIHPIYELNVIFIHKHH